MKPFSSDLPIKSSLSHWPEGVFNLGGALYELKRYAEAVKVLGRATALAAGHGFLAGWAFAIAGDILYFAVIALTTLRLNSYFRDPNTTMLIVLGAMFIVPTLVRKFRFAKVVTG